MIKRPALAPKAGYVEVESNGESVYVKVGQQSESTAEEITLDLLAEHEERLCMLELLQ